jgi:nucleotide-binding universal stress UspA family protein
MPAKTILVPLDFSEFSDAALEYATSLARDTGAELLI